MQINLMPDLSLLAVMAIFICEYFVVKKFFLEPINNVLEERETETRTAFETYEQSLAHFREATADIERRLHETRRDAAQLREPGFGTEPIGVVSGGGEQLGGDFGAHVVDGQQRRGGSDPDADSGTAKMR